MHVIGTNYKAPSTKSTVSFNHLSLALGELILICAWPNSNGKLACRKLMGSVGDFFGVSIGRAKTYSDRDEKSLLLLIL